MTKGRNKLGILSSLVVFHSILSSTLVTRLYYKSFPESLNKYLLRENGNIGEGVEIPLKLTNNEITCDNQNAPDNLPGSSLIRRALHGVIIGTMKGGTKALHSMLLTHPKILSVGKGHGELHFFNNIYRNQSHSNLTVPRQEMRRAFELVLNEKDKSIRRDNGTHDITQNRNIDKLGIHSAPIYMFSGRSCASQLLCTASWVKIIVVLRHPIERAFSQYNFIRKWKKSFRRNPVSFDQYIFADIGLLKHAGVIRDWNVTNFTSFSGSQEEFHSWEKYLHLAKRKGPVGRGLYAIQLEILMDEFKKYNKSIENDLLVLQSEVTKSNPEKAYHQLVNFLGLETQSLYQQKHKHTTDYHATNYTGSERMSEETYKLLFHLFEPYNERLSNLLGEKNWAGVWNDVP